MKLLTASLYLIILICLTTHGAENPTTTVKQPYYPPVEDPVVTDSTDEKVKARREYVKNNLLPSPRSCGQQHNDDRFTSRNGTELDEFPWLAHLKISDYGFDKTLEDTDFSDRCCGVLINNRYVLTDWECGFEALKVVMGEYTTNKNSTCFDAEQGDCSEPRVEYRIESKIRNAKTAGGPYSLTLIRLTTKVRYTDYVRPICLPMENSQRDVNEKYLTFSGWGANHIKGITKKKLTYNITDIEQCSKYFTHLEGSVQHGGVSHVCLSPPPENTEEACFGDHGGPLMYKKRFNWYAGGILINTVNYECNNNRPVSGSLITSDIVNWILDNIKE